MINIKTYKLFVWLLGMSLFLGSCKKFLDKKSNTYLTTIDRLEDLQALLDKKDLMNERTPNYGEISSDDYFSLEPVGQIGFLGYTWQYFDNTFQGGHSNDWVNCYKPINVANICLEEIEKFPRTSLNEAAWDNIKGSALFIRSFYFLHLSWVFSKAYDTVTLNDDLGIAIRLGTDNHVPTVRATVAACYNQIINDTKEAVFYLPAVSVHPLRPSKAAAYGLLARAYLSMRMYDSAYKYADLCLQTRNELMKYNGDGDIVGSLSGGTAPFKQYNKETVFYTDMSPNQPFQTLISGYVDTLLYQSYADKDLRKPAFFSSTTPGYQRFKGSYTQYPYLFFSGIATDEMFLIRAECLARKQMINEAMTDLNTLMIRRWKNDGSWVPFSAAGASEALDIILTERRKELVFRGLRWIDIKRLNKEGAGITLKRIVDEQIYMLPPNSDKYALPIPNDIIQLTGMQQNAGWSATR